jgi:glutaminyl-peptide cyclotransferase
MRVRRVKHIVVCALVLASLTAAIVWLSPRSRLSPGIGFDGRRAYNDVIAQTEFGPRITGSEGNRKVGEYIVEQLKQANWSCEFQDFTYRDTHVRNIIGRGNLGRGAVIIVGAHYDTRRWADRDANRSLEPVPGANDGASGVAVLL